MTMFTNPRDQRYLDNATRNVGDTMPPEYEKKAIEAWQKAFKAAPEPVDTAGYSLTVNPSGTLTISKGTDHLTLSFTDFQLLAPQVMKLYATYSDHEQVINIRAKP